MARLFILLNRAGRLFAHAFLKKAILNIIMMASYTHAWITEVKLEPVVYCLTPDMSNVEILGPLSMIC